MSEVIENLHKVLGYMAESPDFNESSSALWVFEAIKKIEELEKQLSYIYVISDSYDGVVAMSSPVAGQLLTIRDALKEGNVEEAELGLINIADPSLSNVNVWQDLERIAYLPSSRMIENG